METGTEQVSTTELLDLSEDALITIFHKLDLHSVVTVARTTKKLKRVLKDDLVWMELCRPWANLVNIKSWRAQMESGESLYRLLHSLSKLVGLWNHRDTNPCGELLYVTWGIAGLEGWQVVPGSRDADKEVKFIKFFDMVGRPDGSHKVYLVDTGEELPNSGQFSVRLVLPTSKSQNQFVLESLDGSSIDQGQNSNGIRLGFPKSCSLGLFSRPVRETSIWRKSYNRLLIGEPAPGRELAGLWTGLYGPHGWEILTISYTDDGFIVGTKVIGDPNVPSGEITFKGSIGRVSIDFPNAPTGRDPSRRLTKMYKGQGRIALENFLNPTWVPGVLIVEQGGNFYFVWADINFMIRFHRLHLEASFRSRIR